MGEVFVLGVHNGWFAGNGHGLLGLSGSCSGGEFLQAWHVNHTCSIGCWYFIGKHNRTIYYTFF